MSRNSFTATRVFPAYAGMIPILLRARMSIARVPRIRGDDPGTVITYEPEQMCSPHTRG